MMLYRNYYISCTPGSFFSAQIYYLRRLINMMLYRTYHIAVTVHSFASFTICSFWSRIYGN